MVRILFLSLAIASALATPVLAAEATPASESRNAAATALHELFDSEWERGLRDSPEAGAFVGDFRFNDRWSDNSLAAIAAREQADRRAFARIRGIDRSALSPADQLNYDTFLWLQDKTVERQYFQEYLQPISHRGGVQTADNLAELLPFATEKDYQDWLTRMAALPAVIDQSIALMQEGVRVGNLPPKVLMQRVPAQIAAQVVGDPTQSPFYRAFQRMPEGFSAAQREALQAQARRTISEVVVPAYRRLGDYFQRDYLPRCRDDIAATSLPNGKEYYDFLAAYFTTTNLGAEDIHQLGLREVARVRAEMEKVRQQVGFEGDLSAFFTYLRSDPRFFHKTPEALLTAYRALSKRIDPELVKISRRIPRMPYGVRPIPDNIAADTTTAYYQPAAADGSRAGFYYVNLYKPESRPTWEMVPLSLHEAVPGHHFQFALGLELPDAPMFRRTAYFVAYGEGWGLYAEQLGTEMGLYEDPYDRMGQLAYEMWRAVRLVVDTGMHAKGWTREQAIAYFMDNAPKAELDIVNEIDRYISNPGQALAYKIGQLKISELRARAARELGDKFDLRDFNDAVLETGSVPLDALERHIDAWIAARKG